MGNMIRSVPLIACLTISLFGCGPLPAFFEYTDRRHSLEDLNPQEQIDHSALAAIKTIALLDIPNPRHYCLGDDIVSATTFFGTVDEATALSANGRERQDRDINFGATMGQRLKEHLEAMGYLVNIASVSRRDQYKLLDNYQLISISGIDAVLDVVPFDVGLKRTNQFNPFNREIGPHVSVVVRLVSANSNEILYAGSAQYGCGKNPVVTGISIDSPPNQIFQNIAAFNAEKQKAFEQLLIGIDAISRAIAEKLVQ